MSAALSASPFPAMFVVAAALQALSANMHDATQSVAADILHLGPLTSYRPSPSRTALSAREQVTALKAAGLPVSAIAEMARVERKTIYSWLDGAVMSGPNAERMAAVYELLTERQEPSLIDVYRFWSVRTSAGQSLKELLQADVLDARAIRQALADVYPQAERGGATESRMRRNGPGNALLDSI